MNGTFMEIQDSKFSTAVCSSTFMDADWSKPID